MKFILIYIWMEMESLNCFFSHNHTYFVQTHSQPQKESMKISQSSFHQLNVLHMLTGATRNN